MKLHSRISFIAFAFLSLFLAPSLFANQIDDESKILAGILPNSRLLREILAANPSIGFEHYRNLSYAKWMTQSPGRSTSPHDRLHRISEWSSDHLKDFYYDCDVLFYPFGGADILNAKEFFPGCTEYVLVGLEPVGTFPKVSELLRPVNSNTMQLSDKNVATLRGLFLGIQLNDEALINRGYVITGRTTKAQQQSLINGNGPILTYLLANTFSQILSVRTFCLDENGEEHSQASIYEPLVCQRDELKGVHVFFSTATKKKIVTYVQSNLGNQPYNNLPGFVKDSALYTYLEKRIQNRKMFSMFKAASYLTHWDTFSNVRQFVLEHSQGILSDDSGIPFRFYSRKKWKVALYGKYIEPIKDFKNVYQDDLANFYEKHSSLPILFSYGYNFENASLMKWNRIKQNEAAAPPEVEKTTVRKPEGAGVPQRAANKTTRTLEVSPQKNKAPIATFEIPPLKSGKAATTQSPQSRSNQKSKGKNRVKRPGEISQE